MAEHLSNGPQINSVQLVHINARCWQDRIDAIRLGSGDERDRQSNKTGELGFGSQNGERMQNAQTDGEAALNAQNALNAQQKD